MEELILLLFFRLGRSSEGLPAKTFSENCLRINSTDLLRFVSDARM